MDTAYILKLGNSFSRRFFGLCLRCLSSKHVVSSHVNRRTMSLAHIAHSFSVRGSCTIGFWNTRTYKMPISGYKANGHWFRTYKDWAKCRLETRLTDIQSRRSVPSSKVLWTFPHVHRLFLLPKYVSRWWIEFSAPFKRRKYLSPRTVRKLECLTHLCLVSVFLDYSILSGSPFTRAPIP